MKLPIVKRIAENLRNISKLERGQLRFNEAPFAINDFKHDTTGLVQRLADQIRTSGNPEGVSKLYGGITRGIRKTRSPQRRKYLETVQSGIDQGYMGLVKKSSFAEVVKKLSKTLGIRLQPKFKIPKLFKK